MSGTVPSQEGGPPGVARRGLMVLVGDGGANRPRLPMLGGIVDRLSGSLATCFRKISKAGAETRTTQPAPARFAEFMAGVPPTSLIAVMRIGAWNGQFLAVVDGGLAAIAIGLMLGGRGALATTQERRGYTAIERAVVERLARDQIAGALAAAVAPVTDVGVAIDYLAGAVNEASIALPPASCLSWKVTVTIDGAEGSIAFLLPYAAIEPVRAQLSRDPAGKEPEPDTSWRDHLHAELPLVNVPLRAVLERRRISARDVLRWRVGSTLTLNRRHDEPIEIFRDDLLVLRARMAEQEGRIALHIEERRLAEDWPDQIQPADPPVEAEIAEA